MELQIQLYTIENKNEWDNFIINHSKNGTLFHQQQFLGYHPKEKFNDYSLIVKKENQIIALIPGVLILDNNNKRFVSHPGSSAGGIIFEKYATTKYEISVLDLFITHLKNEGCESIELRLGESIFNFPDNSNIEYLLWHHDFKLTTKELSTCLPLYKDESYWKEFSKIRQNKHIDNPIKEGFYFENINDISKSYEVIAKNLSEKFNKKPTHTLAELLDLKSKYPNDIDFLCVIKDEKVHATIVVFRLNAEAVHSFYIAQDYDQKSELLPFLFTSAFKYYKALGFKWFNFGISSRSKWIKWGIHEFKEKIGGRAMERNTWVLENLQTYEIISTDQQ
jgi:hypothetical protein